MLSKIKSLGKAIGECVSDATIKAKVVAEEKVGNALDKAKKVVDETRAKL